MRLSTFAICFVLLLISGSVLIKGIPHLSWEMLTSVPEGGYYFGKEGGILNAIVGSLILSLGSVILAVFIGLPVALFLNVHLFGHRKIVNIIRFILDLLWGVPTIVYGAIGFTLMIYFGLKTSLLAGILTVTLFILPIMIRSMDEILQTVPPGLLETSVSLGSTHAETAWQVYLRQSASGLITAVLLSFGRAIGDAASILFTAGYSDYLPSSLAQPVATLPLAIFFQLSSPVAEVRGRAYASALVLFFIVLIISFLSRYFQKKYHKTKINF